MFRTLWNYVEKTGKVVLLVTLLLLFGRLFILEPARIDGPSMEPTLHDDQLVLVNKYTLLFRKPERGDIVQFYDAEQELMVIKRIVGLPGETLLVRGDEVFIDFGDTQQKLDEPYVQPKTSLDDDAFLMEIEAEENEYIVLGDNRYQSRDSRDYGALHRSVINGVVRE